MTTPTPHLYTLLLDCWDMAETKNVRGVLEAILATPKALRHRGKLSKLLVKVLESSGHVDGNGAANAQRALYLNTDVTLTRAQLEGLKR